MTGLKLHGVVRVRLRDGSEAVGMTRYVGGIAGRTGTWVGVEFDRPVGESDGTWNGERLFSCQPQFGTIVPAFDVEALIKVATAPADDAVSVSTAPTVDETRLHRRVERWVDEAASEVQRQLSTIKSRDGRSPDPPATFSYANANLTNGARSPGIAARTQLSPLQLSAMAPAPTDALSASTSARSIVALPDPGAWTLAVFGGQFSPLSDRGLRDRLGKTVHLACRYQAIIRFIGATQFAPGPWVGLELPAGLPIGKNDGSVFGVRYFVCEPLHGIFVRPSQVCSLDAGEVDALLKLDVVPAPPAESAAAEEAPMIEEWVDEEIPSPQVYLDMLRDAISGTMITREQAADLRNALETTLEAEDLEWHEAFGSGNGHEMLMSLLHSLRSVPSNGDDEHENTEYELLQAASAFYETADGLKQGSTPQHVATIVSCLTGPHWGLERVASLVLSAMCAISPNERDIVVNAININNRTGDWTERFRSLITTLRTCKDPDTEATVLNLVNVLITSCADLHERISLRREMDELGLASIVEEIETSATGELQLQCEVFRHWAAMDKAAITVQDTDVTDPVAMASKIRDNLRSTSYAEPFCKIMQSLFTIPTTGPAADTWREVMRFLASALLEPATDSVAVPAPSAEGATTTTIPGPTSARPKPFIPPLAIPSASPLASDQPVGAAAAPPATGAVVDAAPTEPPAGAPASVAPPAPTHDGAVVVATDGGASAPQTNEAPLGVTESNGSHPTGPSSSPFQRPSDVEKIRQSVNAHMANALLRVQLAAAQKELENARRGAPLSSGPVDATGDDAPALRAQLLETKASYAEALQASKTAYEQSLKSLSAQYAASQNVWKRYMRRAKAVLSWNRGFKEVLLTRGKESATEPAFAEPPAGLPVVKAEVVAAPPREERSTPPVVASNTVPAAAIPGPAAAPGPAPAPAAAANANPSSEPVTKKAAAAAPAKPKVELPRKPARPVIGFNGPCLFTKEGMAAGTVFEKIDTINLLAGDHVDYGKLEATFEKLKTTGPPSAAGAAATKAAAGSSGSQDRILDSKRDTQITVAIREPLKAINAPKGPEKMQFLRNALIALAPALCVPSIVRKLIGSKDPKADPPLLPSEVEEHNAHEKIKRHDSDRTSLSDAELFCLELGPKSLIEAGCADVSQRLHLVLFCAEYTERIEKFKRIDVIAQSLEEIRLALDSTGGNMGPLLYILSSIVTVTSFLNNRLVTGFHLADTIAKLKTTKASTDNNATLLHFIVQQVKEKRPDALDMHVHLKSLTPASLLPNIQELRQDFTALEINAQTAIDFFTACGGDNPTHALHGPCIESIQRARAEIAVVRQRLVDLDEQFKACIKLLGWPPADYERKQETGSKFFFRDIALFVSQVQLVRESMEMRPAAAPRAATASKPTTRPVLRRTATVKDIKDAPPGTTAQGTATPGTAAVAAAGVIGGESGPTPSTSAPQLRSSDVGRVMGAQLLKPSPPQTPSPLSRHSPTTASGLLARSQRPSSGALTKILHDQKALMTGTAADSKDFPAMPPTPATIPVPS